MVEPQRHMAMEPPSEPVLHFSPVRAEQNRRGLAYWAFWLNRISGVVLALYLVVHLGFLSTLVRGPEAYAAFLAVVTQPVALVFDILLAAAAIWHGINGVRVAVVGLNIGTRRQGAMLAAVVVAGLATLVLMALRMLAGE